MTWKKPVGGSLGERYRYYQVNISGCFVVGTRYYQVDISRYFVVGTRYYQVNINRYFVAGTRYYQVNISKYFVVSTRYYQMNISKYFVVGTRYYQLEHPHTVPADGAVGVEVERHQAFWMCDNKPFILVLTTVPPPRIR
ncbi:hypothetical protein NFI96_007211 [Prochilodus magdalenae]|nr:hypothetical protein NFI96_007211 [Prochilodus magdalenae]